MGRSRVSIGAVAIAVIAASCSGEDIAERVIENRIEAEGGQDVDVDFDDGDISIQTEDGEFSIETDDDGNVSIEGVGGSGDESFTVDSEDGETVVETEDGTATFSQGADLPEGFPSDVPLPDDVEIIFSQRAETGDGVGFVVSATSQQQLDAVVESVTDGLEAGGYAQQQLTTTPDGALALYSNAERAVSAAIGTGNDGTTLTITVTPQPAG